MLTSIQPYYIIGLQNKIKVETPGEQKKGGLGSARESVRQTFKLFSIRFNFKFRIINYSE